MYLIILTYWTFGSLPVFVTCFAVYIRKPHVNVTHNMVENASGMNLFQFSLCVSLLMRILIYSARGGLHREYLCKLEQSSNNTGTNETSDIYCMFWLEAAQTRNINLWHIMFTAKLISRPLAHKLDKMLATHSSYFCINGISEQKWLFDLGNKYFTRQRD